MQYADNKGADQPAHPHSLINAFVVCYLDSIISLVSMSEISSLYLASVAVQAGLFLTCSQTRFSYDEAYLVKVHNVRKQAVFALLIILKNKNNNKLIKNYEKNLVFLNVNFDFFP